MPTTALRPETVQDEPFLRRLFASTRAGEMAWLPWTEEQKTAFMAMQYDLRQSQYCLNYPDADFLIVSSMGNPAGRIAVHRGDAAFHLIECCLAPGMVRSRHWRPTDRRSAGRGGHASQIGPAARSS